MNDTKLLLPEKEVQQLLGIGRDACYRLMNSKHFPSIQIGSRRYISRVALEDWIANDKVRKY